MPTNDIELTGPNLYTHDQITKIVPKWAPSLCCRNQHKLHSVRCHTNEISYIYVLHLHHNVFKFFLQL